jgi:membrane protein implicated in regulation of membrane protease activity
MDFIQSYGWIIWFALILVFVIIEVTTVTFMFLMLAIGGLAGLIVGLFGVPWWIQVLVAAVVALLLLFAVRPPLLRALKRGGDRTRSNVDALMGMTGTVALDFNGKPETVKLANGETWSVKLSDSSHPPLKAGDRVVVTAIDGSIAMVAPAERTTHG